jgi:TolA-binding protein
MRRVLPHVIALLLGAGAALLVACGGGGTKGGIPAASAGELKDQLETVRRAVADKRCDDVSGELSQVDDDISSLPGTVDKRLRKSLGDAADLLRQTAKDECKVETTQTQTQTVETETQTQPPETQTQTLPPQTQTAPPATTTTPPTTQPPATTTTPPVTPPPPPAEPPAPVPVPPPGSGGSGGGASPEIP